MLKNIITGAALLLITNLAFSADEEFPIIGGYGFDWLKPKSTRCTQITPKIAKRFKDCKYSKEYAFGLDLFAYSCKLNAHSEYILLKTKAQCQEVLETMQANGESL